MAAMSHRKPLQRYSWYDRILPNYRSLDFKNSRKIPLKCRFLYLSLLELRDTQKLANYKLLSATLFTTSSHDVGCLIFSIQESEKSERCLISCICTLNKAYFWPWFAWFNKGCCENVNFSDFLFSMCTGIVNITSTNRFASFE